jgi:predicted negative regulator of RcsB-dependent stress response
MDLIKFILKVVFWIIVGLIIIACFMIGIDLYKRHKAAKGGR